MRHVGRLFALLCIGAQADIPVGEVAFPRPHHVRRHAGRAFTHKYGFYLHTFGQPVACIALLRRVRTLYPDEPVYIMSDGGKNFSGICAEIGNCNFQWKPPANDRWNPSPFFNRFKEAAIWLNAEFVIYLEPDNELRRRINMDPEDDAGGVKDTKNMPLRPKLLEYITWQGRLNSHNPNFEVKWPHFGLCGGSYLRTDAVLKSFNPARIDWGRLQQLDGKRVFSSDMAMVLALSVNGHNYYPWREVTQSRYGLNDAAALRHYGSDEGTKPGYGLTLSRRDAALVTSPNVEVGKVTCQGCVWTSDENCWKQTPIQCPTTQENSPPKPKLPRAGALKPGSLQPAARAAA